VVTSSIEQVGSQPSVNWDFVELHEGQADLQSEVERVQDIVGSELE